ncbi:hypothetical protein DZJ_02240 [Dickeya ananatis]
MFNNPQHPYTRRLLASVPIADPDRRYTRELDDSEIPSPLRKANEVVEKSPLPRSRPAPLGQRSRVRVAVNRGLTLFIVNRTLLIVRRY